jgi:hypothetical protein
MKILLQYPVTRTGFERGSSRLLVEVAIDTPQNSFMCGCGVIKIFSWLDGIWLAQQLNFEFKQSSKQLTLQ